jgi:hypothetical protein
MTLGRSEKNFLERLADHIPGLAGYRRREARRDTDKRLREHLARRLDRGRERLGGLRRALTAAGALDRLNAVAEVDKRLQRAADALRHATYGYGGAFDQVKVREEEIDRLYRFDLDLLDRVDAVEEALGGAGDGSDPQRWQAIARAVDALLDQIAARAEIFESPGGEAKS